MTRIVHLDYETRSRCDLKACGAHRYAVDPSTEILMAGVSSDEPDAPVFLWVNPKYETPDMLSEPEAIELLKSTDLVYAQNAPFEQALTWGCGERGVGLPGVSVGLHQWRCTAAMGRKAGLPSSLEKLAEALKLEQQKDTRGKALIRFFSIPNKEGKFNAPQDFPEKWREFGDYCRQDVRTEKAIHRKLKAFELTGLALETFLFDLRMNQNGIPVNVPALENARKIIHTVNSKVTEEFQKLTGLNPTQRNKVLGFIKALGVDMPDMQSETVETAIQETADTSELRKIHPDWAGKYDKANRILKLYQVLSFAAVKKVEAMLEMACPDWRVRGCHVYYGTGPGRWAARGIQPQNFKKTPKWMRPITDNVYAAICRGHSADDLDTVYGNPIELISGCIRHFIHKPGTPMFDADYSAIQARGVCWLAGEDSILKMWREGRDLYKFMAAAVYGKSETQITDDERSFGKVIELACGFQMGPTKFHATCEAWGVPCELELAERGVQIYRELHPRVVRYWYFLNESARSAIATPGTKHGPFLCRTIAGIPYLLAELPSGRSLAYPYPKVEVLPGEDRDQITYWGQDPYSTQWTRVKLYGGKLAENITMAVEADIMSHGLLTADKRGFEIVAVIHDQALALKAANQTVEQFVAALTDLPRWAKTFPLKSDGRTRPYYTK